MALFCDFHELKPCEKESPNQFADIPTSTYHALQCTQYVGVLVQYSTRRSCINFISNEVVRRGTDVDSTTAETPNATTLGDPVEDTSPGSLEK